MQKRLKRCLVAAMFLAPVAASAQVTIGNGNPPQPFSVLELISNDMTGLRLPQMNTTQRDDMIRGDEDNPLAQGLQIFNTTTRCVETWNGTKWIGACAPVNCAGFPTPIFCDGEVTTIADLDNVVGSAVVWYAAATGGEPLSADKLLEDNVTYYAGCTDQDTRLGITISFTDCSAMQQANARMTAYTNVMYDFQHQEFEAYVAAGGQPTDYEWFVVKGGVETKIADAPNAAKFRVPADFMYQYGGLSKLPAPAVPVSAAQASVELTVRCKMTNPNTPTPVISNLDVLFIRTNTAGYGQANGNRYLAINNGGGGTFKVALTSLGASEDDNAGDLDDFYQWGRVADGHEKIVWGKDPSTRVNIFAEGTSESIFRVIQDSHVESTGQLKTTAPRFGRFITTNSGTIDWGTETTAPNRWGNGGDFSTRAGSDIAPGAWTYPSNNVCSGFGTGWGVPSRWNFRDMYRGTDDAYIPQLNYDGTVNHWLWRAMADNTNAVGGAVITNSNGEKLFLPASGFRRNDNGNLSNPGTYGYYWSCTSSSNSGVSHLWITSTQVQAGIGTTYRAYGKSVRCVAE